MRRALTDKTVASLKSQARRYEVRDALLPGFGVRVAIGGQKTFFLTFRESGRQRRVSLGHYPLLSLSLAREKAGSLLRAAEHPQEHNSGAARESADVETAVDRFIQQYAKVKNRKWQETQRVLERELVDRHGALAVDKLERGHVLGILDAAVDRG